MAKREFLMQSHNYYPKYRVTGYYVSEKLDGMRAIWIPWTQGIRAGDLDFVNVDSSGADVICSGLFSRYARVIHAPSDIQNLLSNTFPDICVDGELYAGRKQWNTTVSIVKKQGKNVNASDWAEKIVYKLFDIPNLERVFEPGRIDGVHYKKWIKGVPSNWSGELQLSPYFDFRIRLLRNRLDKVANPMLTMVEFEQLPFGPTAVDELKVRLAAVVDIGGEGLMLRNPSATWEPRRTAYLLKVKGQEDGEGIVVGYSRGLGKYDGMLGSVRLRLETGIIFDLSGFTDDERALSSPIVDDFTTDSVSKYFPIGSVITFAYRELSPIGVPKEAKYLRRRFEE